MHHDEEKLVKSVHAGRAFVTVRLEEDGDADTLEWDGEKGDGERKRSVQGFGGGRPGRDAKTVEWVPEPALEARQYVEHLSFVCLFSFSGMGIACEEWVWVLTLGLRVIGSKIWRISLEEG